MAAPAREVARLTMDGKTLKPIRGAADPLWANAGPVTLDPGAHAATLRITGPKAWIGRIVLTNDPTAE